MKLSDVKGERTLDVIAEIIDPVANIAASEDTKALLEREKLPEGMDSREFVIQRIRRHVPGLLKAHKGDVIAIMAAIEGVSPKEYALSLNLAKLIKDCVDLLSDETFIDFFTSTAGASGDASATIAVL